jgi:type II secretory pathway pseudopilin PulG
MLRSTNTPNRPGIALVLSLIAIAVVGALVTGIWTSSAIEQRADENTRKQTQAMAVAEAAAGEVIGTWNSGVWNLMANGASTNISGNSPYGTGTYTGTVTRLNEQFFLLDLTGKDRNTNSKQRVGILVKLRMLDFDIDAALTTRGSGKIGGSVEIDGNDTNPWSDCPAAGPPKAGVRHPDPSQLNYVGGCNSASCIDGSPPVQTDATVANATFFQYGDADWDALKASATIVLTGGTLTGVGPVATSGVCDRSNTKNWGEPQEPVTVAVCKTYFPIIYSDGDMRITGDRGQGILMVNGDLEISGGFVFDGIVLVRGRLSSTGTGGHIKGGALAANVDLDENTVLGNATLGFSSCAITRAKNASSPGAQLRSRGWIHLY